MRNVRLYRYVGPEEIRERLAQTGAQGAEITTYAELVVWLRDAGQQPDASGLVVLTFIIDAAGVLWVADRHTEHVACAGGQPVRSAGELFLAKERDSWEVAAVSNQSTGYCPEPDSWPWVVVALVQLPLSFAAPQNEHEAANGFAFACIFRRCPRCRQINIVKDGVCICALCGEELPPTWNVDAD
jgi:hypothetical protein